MNTFINKLTSVSEQRVSCFKLHRLFMGFVVLMLCFNQEIKAEDIIPTLIDGKAISTETEVLLNNKPLEFSSVKALIGSNAYSTKIINVTVDGKVFPLSTAEAILDLNGISFTGISSLIGTATKSWLIDATLIDPAFNRLIIHASYDLLKKTQVDAANATFNVLRLAMQDLEKRYPDRSLIVKDVASVETFIQKETAVLTNINQAYCSLIKGLDIIDKTLCATSTSLVDALLVAVKNLDLGTVNNIIFGVGVIPELGCGADKQVTVYHDDEDHNNTNTRAGWVGSWVSNRNTLKRFCKTEGNKFSGVGETRPAYGEYAVLKLGLFCPSGADSVWRRHDDEDTNNGSWVSGPAFPNFKILSSTHLAYCVYRIKSGTGGAMPLLGYPYGVFASGNFILGLNSGNVYQDNEDWLNTNFWLFAPQGMMNGTTNTKYFLRKVQ